MPARSKTLPTLTSNSQNSSLLVLKKTFSCRNVFQIFLHSCRTSKIMFWLLFWWIYILSFNNKKNRKVLNFQALHTFWSRSKKRTVAALSCRKSVLKPRVQNAAYSLPLCSPSSRPDTLHWPWLRDTEKILTFPCRVKCKEVFRIFCLCKRRQREHFFYI